MNTFTVVHIICTRNRKLFGDPFELELQQCAFCIALCVGNITWYFVWYIYIPGMNTFTVVHMYKKLEIVW